MHDIIYVKHNVCFSIFLLLFGEEGNTNGEIYHISTENAKTTGANQRKQVTIAKQRKNNKTYIILCRDTAVYPYIGILGEANPKLN